MNENITPLPWNLHRYHVQNEPIVFEHEGITMTSWEAVIAKGDKVLGRFNMTSPTKWRGWETVGTVREAKANAEYVIEAVNAYPALTARVKELEEALARIANRPSEMTWGEDHEVREAMQEMEAIADAALNKEPT